MTTFTSYVENKIVNVFSVKEKADAQAEIKAIGDGKSTGFLKIAKDEISDAETKATNINNIDDTKDSINSILASLDAIKTLITGIKTVYTKLNSNSSYNTKIQETEAVENKFGGDNLNLNQYKDDYFKTNVTDKIEANNKKITALLKEAIAIKTSADSKNNTFIQEFNIMENVVGRGIGGCTGFKIRPDIIFTATHCCSGGNLIKDSITNLNCMMSSPDFKYDNDLVEYVNEFMTDNEGKNLNGLPFNEGNDFKNSWPYIDFMILKNNETKVSYNKDDMVVPILPSKELKTEANYSKFTFKYAHKDGKTTELRELKIEGDGFDKNYLSINGERKLK